MIHGGAAGQQEEPCENADVQREITTADRVPDALREEVVVFRTRIHPKKVHNLRH